jgi:hypothetical protein
VVKGYRSHCAGYVCIIDIQIKPREEEHNPFAPDLSAHRRLFLNLTILAIVFSEFDFAHPREIGATVVFARHAAATASRTVSAKSASALR